MKTHRISNLYRTMIVVLIVGVLGSLTGGIQASAAQVQQSYLVQATTTALAAQLVEKYEGVVTSRLEIIHAVGALLSVQGAAQLRLENGIVAITLNGSVQSSDNDNPGDKNKEKEKNKGIPSADFPNVVGADVVWEGDVIGSGVTVAVLDTGLADLPALVKSADNKHNRIVAWKDFIQSSKKPIDPNGHGSHVAGIIANSQKGADGEWNGVAPDVKLAGVRVLDKNGVGTYESVILGLQWVLENQARYNIRIVNLSLVSPVQSPYWADPLNQAVTQVWANGITVVVAAGNSGPEAMSITVPGNNPYVITVGAFTDNFTPADWSDDYIAPFSSAGPTLDGFVKPDLVAPGGHMVSVVPSDSVLAKQYPNNKLKSNYFKLAGTSQATAVVSGIAALIISNNPEISPNEVKIRLTGTALPWVDATTTEALYSMWVQGAGMVNAPDAVFADVSGAANEGMDIQADLAGTTHYEGYSYYDEATASYRLYDPYGDWAGGYGVWDGKRGSWSGARGSWSGDYGAWSGARGSWSGGYGVWDGKRGSWSGARGSWSGGYSTWAGARGSWSGTEPWAGSIFADPAFISSFVAGDSPDATTSNATTSYFLQDQ
ncbi:MAG: S8 family peptidase [Chloroflexi bacterium]|nr:S8 family peptidase [Chloroflexota bacterium]